MACLCGFFGLLPARCARDGTGSKLWLKSQGDETEGSQEKEKLSQHERL